MLAIFKREFKSYFINVTGYIFIGVLFVFCGIFTMAVNLMGASTSFAIVLNNLNIILMIIIPVLTMKSMAEEKRSKTDQLLYSLPIKTMNVVIGKYLAMVAVFGLACLGMAFVPVILGFFGEIPYGATYAALLGFFMLGSALIAICMFISSLTSIQIVAAVLGIAVSFALYLMSGLVSLIPTTAGWSLACFIVLAIVIGVIIGLLTKNYYIGLIAGCVCAIPAIIVKIVKSELLEGLFPRLVAYLAVFDRFTTLAGGIFDLTAIVYYLSVIVFFVFLSYQSMDKRRWA